MTVLESKYDQLKQVIAGYGRILVAFSGGVDSTLLLKVAKDTLEEQVLAVTAHSVIDHHEDLQRAEVLAKEMGTRHLVINSDELAIPEFRANPPERCYHCKKARFTRLKEIAGEYNLDYVADGSNLDDDDDFRPGMKAIQELGVVSPLKEAGLTKTEIRELSRQLDLLTHDLPSNPCLASRIPYGTEITEHILKQVGQAEAYLKSLSIRTVRVRHHNNIARIEVEESDFEKIIRNKCDISNAFKVLGYDYVALDLKGYRTGALNEVLKGGS
jgi:uncharacterized protein